MDGKLPRNSFLENQRKISCVYVFGYTRKIRQILQIKGHVGLTRAEPDVADENVTQDDRSCRVIIRDGDRPGVKRMPARAEVDISRTLARPLRPGPYHLPESL